MIDENVGGLVELLPCPFCGGKPGIAHRYDTDGCYWATVQCDGCGVQTRGRWASDRSSACPIFYSEVREEWNNRALSAHGENASVQTPVVDEAMVMRAWKAYVTDDSRRGSDRMRAALEAALSAHGQPVVDVQAVVALIGKPLRKIVSVDRHADSIYGYQRVVLECGHEVSCSSRAFSKARCRHCQKNYREALTAALGAAP